MFNEEQIEIARNYLIEKETVAENGDTVMIDYSGSIDGVSRVFLCGIILVANVHGTEGRAFRCTGGNYFCQRSGGVFLCGRAVGER